MKVAEFREMNTEELYAELERLQRHLFDLKAQAVTEKLQNPNQVRMSRQDVARVLTVLRERGLTGVEQHQHHLEAMAVKQARASG